MKSIGAQPPNHPVEEINILPLPNTLGSQRRYLTHTLLNAVCLEKLNSFRRKLLHRAKVRPLRFDELDMRLETAPLP
ncbi:MAG TPA: hypothetical protein VGQ76_11395 [Thermoanaerobaculia bacterium]|nr:hypothetical protein [Thermoanaerobaculia bacterium]